MAGQSVKRADLCDSVYKASALPRQEAATLVEQVLSEISDALIRGRT